MDSFKQLLTAMMRDRAVRLAGLVGAGLGGVMVLVAVWLLSPAPTPEKPVPPVTRASAPPAPALSPPTAPSMERPAKTALVPQPVERYPDLPVARDGADAPADTAVASRTPPEAAPSTGQAPPVAAPGPAPKIAIVIDDMGVDRRRSARAMKLPAKVTLSFLAYAPDLARQAKTAMAGGHEVMMHVSMEPESAEIDPGPNVLLTAMPAAELRAALDWNLGQFTGYHGINNHMGSRFTRDAAGMAVVMKELKARGLFFLDSVTTRDSVARAAAVAAGVPFARRDVFIDHKQDAAHIARQLDRIEHMARETGLAIAIGHPKDATLKALEAWLPRMRAKGFELIGVSRAVSLSDPRTAGHPGHAG